MPRCTPVRARLGVLIVLIMAGLVAVPAQAGKRAERKAAKAEKRRAEIDAIATETLERLMKESSRARTLRKSAVAWAVFDNAKLSLGLTAGGGSGVAVSEETGEREYMRMATGGVNVGLGVQKYQVVFLFNDSKVFERFVNSGWEADASANAVAGKAGANAGASFNNGLAVFQLTEAGLMLQLDISGTKYWKSGRLN